MAGLQCLCVTQVLIHTKAELKEDGRRLQLNSPQAGASNLHATRTFIYPLFLQIWPCPVRRQGPQTAVWTPCNSSITHVHVLILHESCQHRKKTKVKGSIPSLLCVLVSGFLFLLEPHLQFLFNLSKQYFEVFILFKCADTCDCALGQAFTGHSFKMLTCRCGKHSYLFRRTKSSIAYK